ncbi:hypothetical protein GNI_182330 [Gregarina niphandrodes]|uniref:Uncharacterized protein n=1 Tax=Gregarina niphandrodes TaxID=110365 RepID=A0A023AX90_GRENI|nr:hypothetical protein GNI_182330 [Gregarina niphandrodes]EZG43212.1 hypothetical protein GNI_182330 [Gregarina niphandrodes]|eukprot:XP_011133531.1 hypothetical protein GNI_182330 [Gregarina niphandrodes]
MKCFGARVCTGRVCCGWGFLARVAMPFGVNGEWVDMVKAFEWLTLRSAVPDREELPVTKLLTDAFKIMEELPTLSIGTGMFPTTARELTPVELQALQKTYDYNNSLRGHLLRSVAQCLYAVLSVMHKHPAPPVSPDCIDPAAATDPEKWIAALLSQKTEGVEVNDWVKQFMHIHPLLKCESPLVRDVDFGVKIVDNISFLPSLLLQVPAQVPANASGSVSSFSVVVHDPCTPTEFKHWSTAIQEEFAKLNRTQLPLIQFHFPDAASPSSASPSSASPGCGAPNSIPQNAIDRRFPVISQWKYDDFADLVVLPDDHKPTAKPRR